MEYPGMRFRKPQVDLRDSSVRCELAASARPYWQVLDRRSHLGYLRTKSQGIWIARFVRGWRDFADRCLGFADDSEAADGIDALSFPQVERSAWNWYAELMIKEAGKPIDDSPFNKAGAACGCL